MRLYLHIFAQISISPFLPLSHYVYTSHENPNLPHAPQEAIISRISRISRIVLGRFQSMATRVEELNVSELACLVRLMLDLHYARSGEVRSKRLQNLLAEAGLATSSQRVQTLVAKMPTRLMDGELSALRRAASALQKEIDPTGISTEALIAEARRRRSANDYAGMESPAWISTGDLNGVVGLEPDDSDAAEISPGAVQTPGSSANVAQTDEPHDDDGTALRFWADQLGISGSSTSQRTLKAISGDYLIIRYLFTKRRFLSSHLQISPPVRDDLLAQFVTVGGEGPGSHDFSKVRGAAFVPSSGFDLVSVGRVRTETNIRVAMLSLTKKTDVICNTVNVDDVGNSDLYGLRISPGSAVSGQVAHRIWCTKVPKERSDRDILRSVGSYSQKEFRDRFGKKIDDFDYIYKWVTAIPTMSCEEDIPLYVSDDIADVHN